MPKTLLATLGLIVLAACQTPSAEISPAATQPIAGTLTIGREPVRGAVFSAKNRITLTKEGRSGYVDVSTKSLVDVDSTDNDIKARMRVLDADASSVNLTGFDANAAKKAKELIGLSAEISFAKDGRLAGSVAGGPLGASSKGFSDLSDADRTKIQNLVKALFNSFLGGRTVAQGEEVAAFRLKDLIGDEAPSTPDMSIAGRVIGQAVYQQRPVVVVKCVGAFTMGSEHLAIDGVYYVDMFSGVAIYSAYTFSGSVQNGMGFHARATQQADLTAAKPQGPGAAPK